MNEESQVPFIVSSQTILKTKKGRRGTPVITRRTLRITIQQRNCVDDPPEPAKTGTKRATSRKKQQNNESKRQESIENQYMEDSNEIVATQESTNVVKTYMSKKYDDESRELRPPSVQSLIKITRPPAKDYSRKAPVAEDAKPLPTRTQKPESPEQIVEDIPIKTVRKPTYTKESPQKIEQDPIQIPKFEQEDFVKPAQSSFKKKEERKRNPRPVSPRRRNAEKKTRTGSIPHYEYNPDFQFLPEYQDIESPTLNKSYKPRPKKTKQYEVKSSDFGLNPEIEANTLQNDEETSLIFRKRSPKNSKLDKRPEFNPSPALPSERKEKKTTTPKMPLLNDDDPIFQQPERPKKSPPKADSFVAAPPPRVSFYNQPLNETTIVDKPDFTKARKFSPDELSSKNRDNSDLHESDLEDEDLLNSQPSVSKTINDEEVTMAKLPESSYTISPIKPRDFNESTMTNFVNVESEINRDVDREQPQKPKTEWLFVQADKSKKKQKQEVSVVPNLSKIMNIMRKHLKGDQLRNLSVTMTKHKHEHFVVLINDKKLPQGVYILSDNHKKLTKIWGETEEEILTNNAAHFWIYEKKSFNASDQQEISNNTDAISL